MEESKVGTVIENIKKNALIVFLIGVLVGTIFTVFVITVLTPTTYNVCDLGQQLMLEAGDCTIVQYSGNKKCGIDSSQDATIKLTMGDEDYYVSNDGMEAILGTAQYKIENY